MGMSGWADLSVGRQPDRLALTLSAASNGYQEVLSTMIDTGTSDSDVARLVVARKYLLEAIDLEIALRPDDKLSYCHGKPNSSCPSSNCFYRVCLAYVLEARTAPH
jgi:hypothetical protein